MLYFIFLNKGKFEIEKGYIYRFYIKNVFILHKKKLKVGKKKKEGVKYVEWSF